MTTTNRTPAIRTTKGTTMINFRHGISINDMVADMEIDNEDDFDEDAAKVAAKKLAKKLRRQARDEMRALFDFDAIRAAAPASVHVVDAYDVYDVNEDADEVFSTFVPADVVTAA